MNFTGVHSFPSKFHKFSSARHGPMARRKSLGPADGLRRHAAVPPSAASCEDSSNGGGGAEPGMLAGLGRPQGWLKQKRPGEGGLEDKCPFGADEI